MKKSEECHYYRVSVNLKLLLILDPGLAFPGNSVLNHQIQSDIDSAFPNVVINVMFSIQAAGLTLLALGVYTAKYGTGVTARSDFLCCFSSHTC